MAVRAKPDNSCRLTLLDVSVKNNCSAVYKDRMLAVGGMLLSDQVARAVIRFGGGWICASAVLEAYWERCG